MGWIIDGWIGLALGLKYVNTDWDHRINKDITQTYKSSFQK